MYERTLKQEIIRGLDENPAVAVLGARQTGKTTLAHEIGKGRPSIHLDLEDSEDLRKLEDPAYYLGRHTDKLVILDEIQRSPNLFNSLRVIIDAQRREGHGNGLFLVLGSASNELLQQSSDSLAGRIHYCELKGLNPLEIEEPHGEPLRKLWTRGGFPDSYAAPDDQASNTWRQDFIRTYLERDIPQFGLRVPAATLRRFWTMLAHNQGELLNAANLANSLGIASPTVNRYLDTLVDLLLVRKLEPLHANIKKRLTKRPRVYVRDSGIVHALLQIQNYDALLGHPVAGKSWEGFVIETITNALPEGTHPFFYRTSAGAEIDLVIEFGPHDYWAIEIKSGRKPILKKGFHMACADLNVKRKFVVYSGEDKFPAGDGTIILSLSLFLEELKNRRE